ncbi:hypothetical protein NQ318_001810 [Aromia moschata]|uniref:Mannosyltransferase n=1 Tax=Aromia moschata TaxID=1265417 RepID=A0AAV8Z2Y0_9CUCU|nr:hypothetical protein NQ318_001810 [Aromia moschata]
MKLSAELKNFYRRSVSWVIRHNHNNIPFKYESHIKLELNKIRKMLGVKQNVLLTIYWCLAILRILLVLVPQTGYIHPDEFFQSVEVLAGKFMDVECSPPWEFNATFPIRSMAIPYFTIGMSYKVLNGINYILKVYLGTPVVTPYLLLIIPRLLMCLLSFLVDYALYKICSNNNEKYKSRLVILGSSYVTLVYGTRTFSNTIELILFSILLYYVCESLTFSNILVKKRDYINYRYEQSKTLAEKVKFHKLRLFLVSDTFRNCFVISTTHISGVRGSCPFFFWLYRGVGTKSVTALQFHWRMLLFCLCSIPSFVVCILVDSFYYGYITWGEVGMLDVSIDSFVFTPLNFVKYNIDSGNLANHGLHPRFLHILVNVPLLFNVLGVYVMYSLMRYVYICFLRKPHLLPSVRSVKCLMTLSFLTPVALLSVFPHQEPRFLIPVILPLAYLHGLSILPEPDNILVEALKIQPKENRSEVQTTHFPLKIWLVANMLLMIFYGFLHQGGVYQATAYLQRDLVLAPSTTEFHIVTSHIYSLPESFLMQKPSDRLYRSGKSQYSVSRRVFLYEEGSKGVDYILKKLQDIISVNGQRYTKSTAKKFRVYLIISSSLNDKLSESSLRQFFTLNLIKTFYPHVSIEAFPDLTSYCTDLTAFFYKDCVVLSYEQYFSKVIQSFGLSLYEVYLNNI